MYVVEYHPVSNSSIKYFDIVESHTDVSAKWDWIEKIEDEGFEWDDFKIVGVELYGVDGRGW